MASLRDGWWVKPVATFLGLSAFIVYSTWAAFQGSHCESGPYLSPFYSPLIFGSSDHAWFGENPRWFPWSPAFLILWAPAGFRLTCYYYRGAYYKAFWADPPSCAVSEPRSCYLGENSLPLILQNVHRYFLYVAVAFLFMLSYDAWKGMWFDNPLSPGTKEFGIGVGTIVLTMNVVLLSSYTLGCHSMRHLVGGYLDIMSKAPKRKKAYECVSCLNKKHMLCAWCSLFWVGFSDVYVRLCSHGIWSDWRIL